MNFSYFYRTFMKLMKANKVIQFFLNKISLLQTTLSNVKEIMFNLLAFKYVV